MILSFPIGIESFRIHHSRFRQSRSLLGRHLDADLVRDLSGDRALQCEYVAEVAVIGLGPQVCIIRGINQLCRDPHPVSGTLHRSFNHRVCSQVAGDFWNRLFRVLISQNRCVGDYLEAAHL